MPYPLATAADVAFFDEHGWIAITDAVDPLDLVTLEERCAIILEKKESMAFDWAWAEGTPKDARDFRMESLGPVWKSTLIKGTDGEYVGKIQTPAKGWTAFFVELTFTSKGSQPFKFTTNVRVLPDTLPFKFENVAKPH